ncbi:inositol-trisphosphate 3-kinase A-like [Callorhinchus milii]|nr:inositol-trisphosphate 3-kinase A-like [Callorhinchus milii]
MRRVDPEAPSPEDHSLGAVTKLQYMRWRETLSSTSSLAFRIEGLTTADGKVLKDFKQTRSREQITATLLRFTGGEVDILKGYLEQLRSIEEALGRSVFFKTHEVIGSSLLFVHESLGKPEVWLIDFGKTTALPQGQTLRHDIPWEEGNREDGYLLGLHNLMDIFSQALTQRLTDTETT